MEWDGEYTHFRQLYADHYAASRLGTTLIYIAETLEGKMVGQVFIQLTSRNSEVADGLHRAYLFSSASSPNIAVKALAASCCNLSKTSCCSGGLIAFGSTCTRQRTCPQALRTAWLPRYRGGPGALALSRSLGEWHSVHEPAWKMLKKLR